MPAARPIIAELEADSVLKQHGGDFSLRLEPYEPEAAAATTPLLDSVAPLYDCAPPPRRHRRGPPRSRVAPSARRCADRGVSVGSVVELHGLRLAEYNELRGVVVGPCDEGRYPVEVSPKTGEGKKKRIRVKLDNLRTINI